MIRTVRDGEITNTDSRYYFNKKAYEEESASAEQIEQDFQEKNYPSLTLDTDKDWKDPEEAAPGFKDIIKKISTVVLYAVPFFLLVAMAAGGRMLYRKYKDNNRSF